MLKLSVHIVHNVTLPKNKAGTYNTMATEHHAGEATKTVLIERVRRTQSPTPPLCSPFHTPTNLATGIETHTLHKSTPLWTCRDTPRRTCITTDRAVPHRPCWCKTVR